MRRTRLLTLALLLGGLGLLALHPGLWLRILDFAPGEGRRDEAALHPRFAACLKGLFGALEAAGYRPRLRATYRDQARQRFFYELGGTQLSTHSLHQRTDGHGNPAALAADVYDLWPILDLPHAARFYLAMRALAPDHGLRTGGAWKRSDPLWAAYDLGWDPGHVEPAPRQRCLPDRAQAEAGGEGEHPVQH